MSEASSYPTPKRTLRPCLQQPCGNLVVSGRCDQHQKTHRKLQDNSGTRERAFYSSAAWRHTRAGYLVENPLCAHCLQETPPCYKPAAEVDHRVPISRGGDRFAWSNLQSLCKTHHSQKTRAEQLDT